MAFRSLDLSVLVIQVEGREADRLKQLKLLVLGEEHRFDKLVSLVIRHLAEDKLVSLGIRHLAKDILQDRCRSVMVDVAVSAIRRSPSSCLGCIQATWHFLYSVFFVPKQCTAILCRQDGISSGAFRVSLNLGQLDLLLAL